MTISLTHAEAEALTKGKALSPIGEGKFLLGIATPEGIAKVECTVSYSEVEETEEVILSPTFISNKYDEFRDLFPKDDSFATFSKTRPLRTGKISDNKSKFATLVKQHNIHPDDIIKAAVYEKNWRQKASITSGDNKMSYMKGMSSWLSDVENLKTQIEDMNEESGSSKVGLTSSNDPGFGNSSGNRVLW